MVKIHSFVVFFTITFSIGNFISINGPLKEGKLWALLVAGSTGYSNYRHQADICHAYQILHSNGIPDENIIVMMADDVAYDENNPTPGIIINSPGGPNVYKGVPKDYNGNTLTPENFLNILSGNKTAMAGIGSGRVIESGPNDHIFINFVDHGGSGMLCFPDGGLMADELMNTFYHMSSQSMFAKIILYIEACYSGSMFDDILPDDLNIFVVTASDPFESSYACYFDSKRETYLGDVFSISWMNDTEHESLPVETLHHQFERVRTVTNTSHVEEYGDLDIGVTKLSEVIGFNMRHNIRNTVIPPRISQLDVVSNIDAPLEILNKRMEVEKDEVKRKRIKLEKHHLLKKRAVVDKALDRILSVASSGNENRKYDLNDSKYKLGKQNLPCYKTIVRAFSDKCFNVFKNPYVRTHLQKLVNMCAVSWLHIYDALQVIDSVCRKPVKGLHTIL